MENKVLKGQKDRERKCKRKGEKGESKRKTREDNQDNTCVGEGVFFRRLARSPYLSCSIIFLDLSRSTRARGPAVNRAAVAITV